MPVFVTPGMQTELLRFHEAALEHRYTRVPVVQVPAGDEDPTLEAWGEVTVEDGTPIPNLPCMYQAADVVSGDERGATVRRQPSLWVMATDDLALGDRVEAVTDRGGVVILAHAVVVNVSYGGDRAGALTKIAELRVTEAVTQPAGGA